MLRVKQWPVPLLYLGRHTSKKIFDGKKHREKNKAGKGDQQCGERF